MGIFRSINALNRLAERIQSLEDTSANLQRASRKLDLEFTELYDKVSHQMGRMAKRYASREAAERSTEEAALDGSPSDSLDPISRSIMLRRARGRSVE